MTRGLVATLRILGIALLLASPAHPLRAEEFPAAVEEGGVRLERNGVGLCEWGFFEIDLYRAALWLEVRCSDAGRIVASRTVKRIDLVFRRDLSSDQMRKAYRAAFDANATAEEREGLAAEIDGFVAAIGRARKGERLTMVHLPGAGMELRQGERIRAASGGDAFAELVLRLYLGEKPPTKALRKALLGDHGCPEDLARPREPAAPPAPAPAPPPAPEPPSPPPGAERAGD